MNDINFLGHKFKYNYTEQNRDYYICETCSLYIIYDKREYSYISKMNLCKFCIHNSSLLIYYIDKIEDIVIIEGRFLSDIIHLKKILIDQGTLSEAEIDQITKGYELLV